MKSKRSWGTRALSLLLCALCLCFAAPALAANGAVAEEAAASGVLIYPEAFGCSRIYRNEEGYFVNHDTADYAALGKTEAFSLELWASEFTPSGEQARVTVTSEGYDFTDALPVLLIPVEDTYYVCPIDDYEAGEHELTAVVTAGYLGVNAEAPVYLYFEGIKLGVDNTVYATVEKVPSTQFDFGATIQVGEYFVRKQGGVLPVEVAIGMGDMDEDCTVYLIYDLVRPGGRGADASGGQGWLAHWRGQKGRPAGHQPGVQLRRRVLRFGGHPPPHARKGARGGRV